MTRQNTYLVPESAVLQRERKNKYGSVPGLDDAELADPDELERQIYIEEFGPILQLPRKKKRTFFPFLDSKAEFESNAFASIDFERIMPEFDKARYKRDKLREELKDTIIMMDIIKERLPRAKYMVLKNLRMGVIELEQIANHDMKALARWYLRARRLREEIRRLEEASRRREERLCLV